MMCDASLRLQSQATRPGPDGSPEDYRRDVKKNDSGTTQTLNTPIWVSTGSENTLSVNRLS